MATSGTRVTKCGVLTIANGAVDSSMITHLEYGDAEALAFFCPAGMTSITLQAAPDDEVPVWYTVITGTTPVIVTTAVAVVIAIIPPAAKAMRVVAGAAVAGAKTIEVNKMWVAGGG